MSQTERLPLTGQVGRLKVDTAYGPPKGTRVEVVELIRRDAGDPRRAKVRVRTIGEEKSRTGVVAANTVEV